MCCRVDSLSRELNEVPLSPTRESIPMTDIDQLARSMDSEDGYDVNPPVPQDPKVGLWLEHKSTGVNGLDTDVTSPKQYSASQVSNGTSEKHKVIHTL